MAQVQPNTSVPLTPSRPASHLDLMFAVQGLGDVRRAQRISDCDRVVCKCFVCGTPDCGHVLRVSLSCREHLCPKQQATRLPERVESALEAAHELQAPACSPDPGHRRQPIGKPLSKAARR